MTGRKRKWPNSRDWIPLEEAHRLRTEQVGGKAMQWDPQQYKPPPPEMLQAAVDLTHAMATGDLPSMRLPFGQPWTKAELVPKEFWSKCEVRWEPLKIAR